MAIDLFNIFKASADVDPTVITITAVTSIILTYLKGEFFKQLTANFFDNLNIIAKMLIIAPTSMSIYIAGENGGLDKSVLAFATITTCFMMLAILLQSEDSNLI